MSSSSCVDQSTQVNFPPVSCTSTQSRNQKRLLQRNNTSQELWSRTLNNNSTYKNNISTCCYNKNTMHQSNSANNISNTRPKSLVLQPGYLSQSTGSTTSGTGTPLTGVKTYNNTSTDASSVSLDSATSLKDSIPPSHFCQEVICIDNGRKWNGPIAAYNIAKVWKSSGTVSSPSEYTPSRYVPPYPQPDYTTYNIDPPGYHTSHYIPPVQPSMKDTFREDSADGLSWRRLHMSRAKLKATATTSELLSGFAMVAMVELQINEPTNVPEWLFVMFSVCTTVLVAVHIFALMISTYLLPNIDAISKLEVANLVNESPHDRMRGFIELAWAFSTVFGLFLFLVEVAILCWVKFWDFSFLAAIAATVIVIPVLCIFIAFAVHFYHSLVIQKCETSVSDIQKLEDIKRKLDDVSNSV